MFAELRATLYVQYVRVCTLAAHGGPVGNVNQHKGLYQVISAQGPLPALNSPAECASLLLASASFLDSESNTCSPRKSRVQSNAIRESAMLTYGASADVTRKNGNIPKVLEITIPLINFLQTLQRHHTLSFSLIDQK